MKKIKKICQKWLPSRKIYAILPFVLRECWNWQTGKTKDLVGVCSCGFKSHLPHFRKRNPSRQGSFFVSHKLPLVPHLFCNFLISLHNYPQPAITYRICYIFSQILFESGICDQNRNKGFSWIPCPHVRPCV